MKDLIVSIKILLFFMISISISQAQNVGIGTTDPISHLHIAGSTNQIVKVHKTTSGSGLVGIDLMRDNEFSATDWRIVNDGGTFQILDAINNFTGAADLNMIITQSGNVGMGTKAPSSKLHLAGDTDQFVKVHRTTSGSGLAGIDFLRHNEFSATDWRIVNDGGTLQFLDATNNFTGAADLNMIISQSGFVGIGTDSPSSRLHLAGTDDQFIKVHRTTAGSGLAGIDFLRSSEFSGTDWRIVNDGGVLQFRDGINNFSGASDLNMTIGQGGNVGIGIEVAQAALHVDGDESVGETGDGYFQIGDPDGNHLRFDGNEILARSNDSPSTLFLQYWSGNLALCQDNDGRVGVGTSLPIAKVQIVDGDDVNLSGGGELVLGMASTLNMALDGNEIQARNDGAASTLFIQQGGGDILLSPFENGQVGIGVSSSANMPSNDYLLAVDGKIISEEVRVEVSGSWPDYVFESNYELTPLDILETQIKEKGHLPGIPSANEVESNGIELGDMQKRMMEKIEELTLYVIELKKEIEELKKD